MANYKQPKTLKECLELQAHFIGIPKITKRNCEEFYKRGKDLQVLGVGFWEKGRMPTIEEVKEHIDLETQAEKLQPKQWQNILKGIIKDKTDTLIQLEKSKDKTLNEYGYNFS